MHPSSRLRRTMGLLQSDARQWRAAREALPQMEALEVEALIEARLEARRARNWAESDRIRDALAARSILLKDNKDGTTSWTVARKGAA